MTGLRVKALQQPGFSFKGADLLNTQLATRLYAAALGPIDNGGDLEDLRLAVEKRLKEIFHICLQSRVFYTAVGGSDIFWRFASEHWDTFEYVNANEVAAFVETYQTARENCDLDAPTGELSDIVDEFIKMHKKMIARGPKRPFQIALRPATFSQAAIGNAGSAVSNKSPIAATQWPPLHFTEQEIAWFSHDHVLSQLYGVTSNTNIANAVEFPRVPDTYTHPLDIRLFLAFTALANFRSDRKISLCMAPVTFWDDDERKDWYLATGGASKFCWTTSEFCQWAKGEFNRGRDAVVGLSHFSQTAPRYSVGVLLRKLGKDNYEFIMEDAHYHRVSSDPAYYEDNYGVYSDSGMDFKSALLQDVVSHFNITSFWHGGEVPNALAPFGICLSDSVSTSCSFVYLAAQEKVPKCDLHQEGWNFSRDVPERMRYWENRESRDRECAEADDIEMDEELEDYDEDEDEGSEYHDE
ncbi:hypothetical protein F5Y09DRAFT_353521 [Xylaria sp. FL1042]|nr:hypothetical protein F5Y09DRAFT_353521 [Xylaria sp. FL1042]